MVPKTLKKMTRQERSLLFYLETCAVDNGGRVEIRSMSAADAAIAERWTRDVFIGFGRVGLGDMVKEGYSKPTHWCFLSGEAWDLAHEERRERAARRWAKRDWKTEQLL